ncbi:MAG TPA: hypothetical protein VN721_14765 [Flavipsychrobacter sp.]|nr:hypothetical protein [Flavipsychrobacter sp.]
MDELFVLPITYKGEEREFEVRISKQGYTYKIFVLIDTVEVTLEKDEERNYRAVMDKTDIGANKIDIELVKVIVDTINSLL